MSKKSYIIIAVLVGIALSAVGLLINHESLRNQISTVYIKVHGKYTVKDRLDQYGQDVQRRLAPDFQAAGLSYPPKQVAYIAFKDTKQLEVYARSSDVDSWGFIRTYPILKASGRLGPKLKEGDLQVPEGIYRSNFLNPNSRYHLSIRVNYPNPFDQRMAKADGRSQLGGDIMIHGDAVSIGCLAMGNVAAEELFILTALTDSQSAKIVISPTDFRVNATVPMANDPHWLNELYDQLRHELKQFKQ